MSCIRGEGDAYIPGMEQLTLVDGGTVNGLTATSVGEAVPPDSPQRIQLKPALGHIDFWPSCQTRALHACDATFENFE